MRGKQNSRQIAKRLNDIGPYSNKNEVEGLARSVAHRIAKGIRHYAVLQANEGDT